MNTGNNIRIRWPPGTNSYEDVTIIDDCYRLTDDRCTVLVRLNRNPDVEFELNFEELKDGEDI
jgi:hypothetical protein